MKSPQFSFSSAQFNSLFPFHILVNSELRITSAGSSLQKVSKAQANDLFCDFFTIKRPALFPNNFKDFIEVKGQQVVIEVQNEKKIAFKGQIDFLEDLQSYLFVGTPCFAGVDQMQELDLSLNDFTLNEPLLDLLQVLQNREFASDEVNQLLITLQNQKNKLQQSEAKYRAIVETATDIIYKVNELGYFTFVNEVAERITGYSREELLQMYFPKLISKPYRANAIAFYIDQLTNQTPTTYLEFPIMSKTKKEIWIGQSVQWAKNEEGQVELTSLAFNISQRKQAEQNLILQEEKYRNIIANMNLGLMEVDLNDTVQYVNQSFCKMSGFNAEDMVGKKAVDLLMSKTERDLIMQKTEQRKDGVSDLYELPIKNKTGELRWWLISGAPRYNDEGELVGTVGIHLDITDQKRLEIELKLAKNKAEDSSKAKESFLATMSHEIRTPLNAIVGITDLMKLDKKTWNEENLDILSFSAKNLLALITDILDLTKIDAGKITMAQNPIDLKALLTGINQMFRSSCEEKNVEIILSIDTSVPQNVRGDELRLSQILNNLISNAVKFTHKGYVKINVSASQVTETGKTRIAFKVTDTGIGIRKDKLETIFNVFEQADSSIVRQFGGTGLGLSITKKLIELQGGEIKVESKLNKGSSFSFYIDYEVSKARKTVSEDILTKSEIKGVGDKLILLVEDNIVNQKVALSYLNHWGMKCEVANNGLEAMEMLNDKHYDLALIDLFMPVMDGFETLKRIRRTKALKKMPAIALTASAEVSLMENAIAMGANKCLTKPFNAQQLHETLLDLLNIEDGSQAEKQSPYNTLSVENEAPLIHLKTLEDASMGSQSFIHDMLETLGTEIKDLIYVAGKLLHEGNYVQFGNTIHKLKSNMLMLGMDFLHHDLRFMEENGRKQERTDELEPVFNRLQNTWQKAKKELEQLKGEPANV